MRALALALALALLPSACGSKSADPADPGGGGRCTRGEYFVPGCSDEPGIVAGCYERCAGGRACRSEMACTTVTIMPACALAESDVACAACGEETELCLPSTMD
jgi:hypothetical protein